MIYLKHIEINPDIMLGKPVIKGTRITVESILKKMAEGASTNDVVNMYSDLEKQHVYAALNYSHN